MIKLDLQMFSEDGFDASGFGEAGVDNIDAEAPETSYSEDEPVVDTRSFDEMYEQGPLVREEPEEEPPAVEEPTPVVDEQTFKNEQNARFAAQRRQQEEQARTQKAVQDARDAAYRDMFKGKINPYTNRPINSEADYREYEQQFNAEQMSMAGVTQAQLDDYVNSSPVVQNANRIIQENQEREKAASIERGKQRIEEDVKSISLLDPDIKSFSDIVNAPNFNEINERVQGGMTLLDAYKLLNFDKIMQRRQDAAKQRTLNQVNGTAHMKATSSAKGEGNITVPPEIIQSYREMIPGVTMKQIESHYKRQISQKG